MKKTGKTLQNFQDQELFQTNENSFRGCISTVKSDKFFKLYNEIRGLYNDANNFSGWETSQRLLYENIRYNVQVSLKEILETDDDAERISIVAVDMSD